MEITLNLLAIAAVYLVIVYFVFDSRNSTYDYKCTGRGIEKEYKTNQGTVYDAWVSLFWPLLFLAVAFFSVLGLLHQLVNPICMLVGFRYDNTKTHKKIKEFIGRRI